MSSLLELIDAYVEKMRDLPRDAADDESRYGDTIQRAEAMRAEIERRLSTMVDTDGAEVFSTCGQSYPPSPAEIQQHEPIWSDGWSRGYRSGQQRGYERALGYVSRGRNFVDVEPYPDALARRTLADYLEAVGHGTAQSAADGPTHPDLPDEGRTGDSPGGTK